MEPRFEQASEYVRSRQGAVQLTATVMAVVGLLFGLRRVSAAGVALYGFVVLPVTMVTSWRERREMDRRIQAVERVAFDLEAREAGREDPESAIRQTLGPTYVQLRQLDRRLGRIEAANDGSARRL